MSSKSQLDLLVKVRYTNPLPPPPYPPKLLNIPTDPKRYAKTEFTQQLSNDTPLPMVVDAELGMPLDLSHWDELWNGSTGESALNPSYRDAPPTDPRDLFMLEGFVGTSSGGPNAGINVSWLRKTEYISRDASTRHGGPQEIKAPVDVPIDVSRASQLRSIEDSFPPSTDDTPIDLTTLQHPTKKNVTAVETFEVLPDSDLWANSYDIFRFAERPGERPLDRPDARLDSAVLRPMMAEGDHFLAYYLTKDDEDTEAYKDMRADDIDLEDKAIDFHWIRDYETAKVEQEVPNEFLLVLDNGPEDETEDVFGGSRKSTHDVKGAYYSTIGRKIMLKKKRQNKYDATYENKWDVIQLSLAPFSVEEQEERDETLAEVVDPQWSIRVAEEQEADAEGEAEEVGPGRTNGVNGHGYGEGMEDAEAEGEDDGDAVMGDGD